MDHSLVAFALVADEYERSGDPVKGLAPLFKSVLSGQAGKEYQPAEFAAAFSERYGFFMPAHVARGLAVRLAEIEILREVKPGRYLVADALESYKAEFNEDRLNAAIELFVEWSERELERLGLPSEGLDLADAFLARLARPEFASVFTAQAAPRSAERIKGLLGRTAVSVRVNDKAVLDYLVARFVLNARRDAPDVFEELNAIAFGALIADAVAGLSAPGNLALPDPGLRVIIDGPLLLDYFNLNTDEHKEYADGLFRMMREANLVR